MLLVVASGRGRFRFAISRRAGVRGRFGLFLRAGIHTHRIGDDRKRRHRGIDHLGFRYRNGGFFGSRRGPVVVVATALGLAGPVAAFGV